MDRSINLECVRPREDQARLIYQWYQDPETRVMSFHTETRSWEEFYHHFIFSSFKHAKLPPLFIVSQGERVGFASFCPVAHPTLPHLNCCEISINIAPEHRQKGLGTDSLIELNAWAAERGYDAIQAQINKNNIASIKAFEKAGYREIPITQTERFKSYLFSIRESKPSVFIIAEVGSNWRIGTHDENISMAKELISIAAEAGADAVKFQVFQPKTTYVQNAGVSEYLTRAGIREEISELFKTISMPDEMIPLLADCCRENKIEFMASSFSPADFVKVDPFVLRHKIASYEISHLHLIDLAAQSNKPLILSTGASAIQDIEWAVERFKKSGGTDLTLLQCTAKYPASIAQLNLRVIPFLKEYFTIKSGLSDHSTHPTLAPVVAVALGATIVEKHFTKSKNFSGPDHAFAVEPDQLKEMVNAIRDTEKMLGSGFKDVGEDELELYQFARRGIQAIKPIAKGDPLIEGENIAILRPGKQALGVHPRNLENLMNCKATRDIEMGSGVQKGDWE